MKKVILAILVLTVAAFAQEKPKAGLIAKATAHTVTLNWTASVTPGVTGYNIYRGTTAGGEGAQSINTSIITGATTFIDTTVVSGTTYFYTAKSYCTSCTPNNFSAPSNEIQVLVPGDAPAPPTNLTGSAQ